MTLPEKISADYTLRPSELARHRAPTGGLSLDRSSTPLGSRTPARRRLRPAARPAEPGRSIDPPSPGRRGARATAAHAAPPLRGVRRHGTLIRSRIRRGCMISRRGEEP